MSHRQMRRILTSALTVLILAIAGIIAYAQTTGFRVISVLPNPFNPSQGQVATITYSVPTMSNPRIYVRNGAGNFPSGTVIGRTTNVNPSAAMDGYADGAFHFNISASLTAGIRSPPSLVTAGETLWKPRRQERSSTAVLAVC